ncbi:MULTISPECIES: thioredoxin [unclassified Ruminococcus]|uniref:thioredoxin n=1 Tax=unclassified Ruminococcus TaxID=2608920 RepID=UPI00210A52F6|nr:MULTISPECIES: thioredoxin [unclassified Ruminococcus]MCQ4022653.1 thioredoxin [Ruminococcus sp. zg-924]MCQ4114893.1 thioredoxin [Ruminococcus sp. zg-921]
MAILHPTNEEFKDLISSGVTLVDFYADWCGPCKMLSPFIEQIANNYDGKIKVAKINVDENSSLAASFGVASIPTVIIFKDGVNKAVEVGFKPIDSYTGIIDSLI